MSQSPYLPLPRLDLQRHAFFLDVDGTLVEFACRPDRVKADPALLRLLLQVQRRAGGALALISGRTIASIDEVTAPERFAAAGIHGFERRNAHGAYLQAGRYAALDGPRAALQALSREHPGLLLEDKGVALALHFRSVPELAARATTLVQDLAGAASSLKVQLGRQVVELLPRTAGKGRALAAFMDEAPFHGRLPIFVGDDLTDEPAFEWVNANGGLSIAVAADRVTAARAGLPSVSAVRNWLDAVAGNGHD